MYLLKSKAATCEVSSYRPDYDLPLSQLECDRMGRPISLEDIFHAKRISSQYQLTS